MSNDTFAVAKTLGHISGWRLSNLEMQKLLYMAHMLFMGRTNGKHLVDEQFEAWDYGPVLPSLYHRVKFFGTNPISDVFFSSPILRGEEASVLQETYDNLSDCSPADLVAMTHRQEGAWYKNYESGRKNKKIPDLDILDEYKRLSNVG